ncbi:tRNA (adenosine(37)-N6)-threonylcarbamoyltransferase complex ATPase subunit type 1 TsaE, partial [Candidatus Parcubacteria bacterium]
IIFVEWPDIFGEGVLSPDKIVKFKFVDENTREIEY